MKIKHCTDMRDRRRCQYPDVSEQLDALFHLAETLTAQGQTFPPPVVQWLERIRQIKERYPIKGHSHE